MTLWAGAAEGPQRWRGMVGGARYIRDMRRSIPRSRIARGLAGAGGAIVLAGAWYLGSPLFVRTSTYEALPSASAAASPTTAGSTPPRSTTPSAPTSAATASGPVIVAKGELRYVDSLHHGTGPVSLLRVGSQTFVRFDDVMITNAPDVHVYLSRETGGTWSASTSLYLGALKATNGSFNYEIPAGIELAQYRSVVVWCRQFSVLITWADLAAV